jgi:hypothetical protein
MKPQHFDILGVIAFVYVTGYAVLTLLNVELPIWSIILLLITGVLGLIVDLGIVYKYFINKK